ncbi:MAG: bifunctional DNA-binding transcriptional regulator/O6-methylguanine-DNA methyltransferase Ada [Candidatus Zixiibacteriota bacterium]
MLQTETMARVRNKSVTATFGTDTARWEAVEQRDPAADGQFVYAVASTGIFCRPTCPSRRPKRDRVVFFDTTTEARRAGYRACARCNPEGDSSAARQSRLIEEACAMIRGSERMLSLADLARQAGLSESHFHRLFRRTMGVTPRGYRASLMIEKAKGSLRDGDSVAGAMFDAGFSSSSRFYEAGASRMGMTPRKLRAGGVEESIRYAVARSSLGHVLVAATPRGICEVWLGEGADSLARRLRDCYPNAAIASREPAMQQLVRAVVEQVDKPSAAVDLPLDLRGTAFQMRVWRALMDIPFGTTRTYGEIAQTIGRPKSSRAVGQACARNHVAVLVPCHRAVGADASLHGYRWGTKRKRTLLERERKTAGESRS